MRLRIYVDSGQVDSEPSVQRQTGSTKLQRQTSDHKATKLQRYKATKLQSYSTELWQSCGVLTWDFGMEMIIPFHLGEFQNPIILH